MDPVSDVVLVGCDIYSEKRYTSLHWQEERMK